MALDLRSRVRPRLGTSTEAHHGWFCNGPCEDDPEKPSHFWNASQIWQRYMATVGSGRVATLNAPPGTTGQIPQDLVRPMTQFGAALRRLPVHV